MFRWGILSTAKIAREHLVPAMIESDNGMVSAIASRSQEKADAFARQFQIPHAFGSYEALLASDAVDGICIPLTTNLHVEWAIRAADAGKHVLVEKPLALDAGDIKAVIDARDRNGVTISEAFMVTYHPQWIKVRDLIADGAIGTLKMVQGAFSYFNRDAANMRNVLELGGGALPDIGVYPAVTTRFATGQEPVEVMARIERDAEFGTDVFSTVSARFGSFDMQFYVSTQLALCQTMRFHGDAGMIEVQAPFNAGLYDADKVFLHSRGHDHVETFHFTGVNQYRLQCEAFVRHALGGKDPVFRLEDSVRNQAFIDAIFRSAKSGSSQTV